MKVVLIDAYDSFVFIIRQYLQSLGLDTQVIRRDQPDLTRRIDAIAPDIIVLGPGPGHPRDAGYVELLHRYGGQRPMLGVCLGHQAIGLAYGGEVSCAATIMHGKVSTVLNDGRGVYAHTRGEPIRATRYHSLSIREDTLPPGLAITSRSDDDGTIMGVRHATLPIEGVQFHPESVLTSGGIQIFQSFIGCYLGRLPDRPAPAKIFP
jgi:anthranilate synthase component 2